MLQERKKAQTWHGEREITWHIDLKTKGRNSSSGGFSLFWGSVGVDFYSESNCNNKNSNYSEAAKRNYRIAGRRQPLKGTICFLYSRSLEDSPTSIRPSVIFTNFVQDKHSTYTFVVCLFRSFQVQHYLVFYLAEDSSPIQVSENLLLTTVFYIIALICKSCLFKLLHFGPRWRCIS